MNRTERRALRRAMAPSHRDCDCVPRLLVPVERTAGCPDCQNRADTPAVPLPTASPLGSLTTLHLGCCCGGEVEIVCVVERL